MSSWLFCHTEIKSWTAGKAKNKITATVKENF